MDDGIQNTQLEQVQIDVVLQSRALQFFYEQIIQLFKRCWIRSPHVREPPIEGQLSRDNCPRLCRLHLSARVAHRGIAIEVLDVEAKWSMM